MTPEIYLIPGLGFDDRIFSQLELGALPCTAVNWILPHQAETIEAYAGRLLETVKGKENGGPKIIVGHSFGGIVGLEMAKITHFEHVILISSIKSREELPFFFKSVSPLGLYRVFNQYTVMKTFPIWANQHGYDTAELKALFLSMVARQSDRYLKWALKTLSEWSGKVGASVKITHIHGERDATFPVKNIRPPALFIPSGDHFMVFKQGLEISRIISDIVSCVKI